MLHGSLPWYVARSSGLVAWALLAGAVTWGLLMTSKVLRGRIKNSWLLDLHRWLGGLALTFTAVHVLAILGDSYVHFGIASVLVPFVGTWHPGAVAWGIVSMYMLAAVELTSLLRKRLKQTLWRRIHVLSFPLFVTSTLHGLTAGTDSRTPMVLIAAALTFVAVSILAVVRINAAPPQRSTVPSGRIKEPTPCPTPAPSRGSSSSTTRSTSPSSSRWVSVTTASTSSAPRPAERRSGPPRERVPI